MGTGCSPPLPALPRNPEHQCGMVQLADLDQHSPGASCVSAGEGADRASSCPNRCSLRNHKVPGCIRNCLEAGASCRCPTLMNHTLSGPGVPNGRVTTEMPTESCPGMHLPPHHTIPARQGLNRHLSHCLRGISKPLPNIIKNVFNHLIA